MLQCANENVTIGAGFLGASKRMAVTSNVHFGTIDCNGKLPSNKTFWQRFAMAPKTFSSTAPAGFLFANNNDPLAIPDKYINDAKKLSDWAEKYRSAPGIAHYLFVPNSMAHFVGMNTAMMLNFTLLSLTSSEGLRTTFALTERMFVVHSAMLPPFSP